MLEKDVVGGDRAGEDGDGVGNFGVGGGGFNRSCCCILVAQILGWRAIPSRAKPGELILAELEKNEPSRVGKPRRKGESSRAGLPDRESVAAFPIQSG
jgi:hypothetical protein